MQQLESEIYRQISHYSFQSSEEKKTSVARLLLLAREESICIDQRVSVPASLCRKDGESIFIAHGSTRYTSQAVLDAEQHVAAATQKWLFNDATEEHLASTLAQLEARNERSLSEEQVSFVRHLLFSPSQIAVGIGAAGTGKTTVMEAFTRAVEASGHQVWAYAPSAKAADVLSDSLGITATTLATATTHGLDAKAKPGDVLLVDEAGMASTRDLDALLTHAEQRGLFVRMVGDPNQLSSVETGGLLEELATLTDAPTLTEVRRFRDKDEAAMTLKLRAGDAEALDWYETNDRIVTGLREELPGVLFTDWCTARAEGKDAIMIASDLRSVDTLNQMARHHFLDAGIIDPDKAAGEVDIAHSRQACVGDVVVTRENNSAIRFGRGAKHRVKNGDLWTITHTRRDGSITVRHHGTDNLVELPADYVTQHVELGYAATVHRSQGMTVDEAFLLPSPKMDRQGFYVGMTRGKTCNRVYVPDDEMPNLDDHTEQLQPPSARDVLEQIIARDGRSVTAHRVLEQASAQADLDTLTAIASELSEQITTEVVAAAAPDAETAVLLREDWQTARLGEAISALDAKGKDTDELLSAAIERAMARFEEETQAAATQDDADKPAVSLAFLVRMELNNAAGDDAVPPRGGDQLLWTAGLHTPPAWRECLDPAVHRMAQDYAAEIEQRLAAAADKAADQHPQWVMAIGEYRPEDEAYHQRWREAVRVIAAGKAAGDTTVDDLTDLPEGSGYEELVTAVATAAKKDQGAHLESLGRGQLERFATQCEKEAAALADKASGWEHRAAVVEQMRPAQEKAIAERAECLRLAELGKPLLAGQEMLAEHLAIVQQAREKLAAAQAERNPLTRRGKIKDAQGQVTAAEAARDKVAGYYHQIASSLPEDREKLEIALRQADDETRWAHLFAQANAEDDKAISQAMNTARRLRVEQSLLQQQARKAHAKLEEHKPLSSEEAKVYIQRIKETLSAKKAQKDLPPQAATGLGGMALTASDLARQQNQDETPVQKEAADQQEHPVRSEKSQAYIEQIRRTLREKKAGNPGVPKPAAGLGGIALSAEDIPQPQSPAESKNNPTNTETLVQHPWEEQEAPEL